MSIIKTLKIKIQEIGFKATLRKMIVYVNNYFKLKIEKILNNHQVSFQDHIVKAIEWLQDNYLINEGIAISSKQKISYPEVSGYMIPTLYNWGEKDLAKKLITWLISQQNKDGSFSAPDGLPYTFDTGQIIRGFVSVLDDCPEVEKPLRKACDWILKQIQTNGQLATPSTRMWNNITDDRIHLYVIPPLIEAGKKLNELQYIKAGYRVLEYYKTRNDLLEFNTLSHFYGYIIEALYDLGEYDLVQKAIKEITKFQKKDGSIPAYKNTSWICIPGVAQFAIIFYKLGIIENGDKALKFLEKVQNLDGGFYGSIGIGANYFPFEEISWAVKFFLDASYWRIKTSFEKSFDIFPEEIDISDGRIQEIISYFGDLNNKKIIDIGCGKGRFIKALHSLFPKAEFYGIDISERMINFCPKEARVLVGNILDIKYPSNFFDYIYCVETLEHSVRPNKAIEEMVRILKPGGKIVIIDKNLEKSGKLKIEPWEQWFNLESVLEILKQNKVQATAKYITYDNLKESDKLFIAWEGIKM